MKPLTPQELIDLPYYGSALAKMRAAGQVKEEPLELLMELPEEIVDMQTIVVGKLVDMAGLIYKLIEELDNEG